MKKNDLLAGAAFLCLVLFFFYRFLDGSVVLAFKDLSRYFYPLRYLMAEQVRAGQLPLWDPYIFCGFPLLATLQICFFYPLTIIHYLLPFNLAFNYYTILHYFLAACFMYALLRHYRLSAAGSFFGGLVFAFSGYLLSVSNMNTSLSSVIWLPLALLFFDKLINSSLGIRHSSFAWFSLLLALMFLGGEPTIIYVSLWFLFFYAILFSEKKARNIGLLFLACLLAAGLVAVQLLPFAELSGLSDRLSQTDFQIVSLRSFPPREMINFVLPYFFGNPGQLGSYTETLLGEMNQNWLITPYLGIIPLIMIFFAFTKKRSGFFLAAALVALLLAFGRYTPAYFLLYRILPGIALIRYPVKFLFLTTFCLSLLAAFGFDELLKGIKTSGRALIALAVALALCVKLSIAGLCLSPVVLGSLTHRLTANVPNYFIRLLGEIIQFNLSSLFNLTALVAALLALLTAAYYRKISRGLLVGGLLLLTAADLFANGISVTIGAPAEIFSATTVTYALMQKDSAPYRFFYSSRVGADNQTIYGENYAAALVNAQDDLCDNWHILHHRFDFFGYESIKPWKLLELARAELSEEGYVKNLDILSAANVKYILSLDPITDPRLKLLRHKHAYGTDHYFYENRSVMPRAYFLDNGVGEVKINEYRPGRIALATDGPRAATLFLAESYYPGWKALVDGKEVKISRAKEIFEAVNVPAGEHKVIFVYDPWTFKLGAAISIVCFLSLGFWVFKKWGG